MITLLLLLAVEPDLVPGKFGNALNVSRSPIAFAGDTRYRTPPLTVECWANLDVKRDYNVLVASDEKTSADHWELYSYLGSGRLSALLPGYEPPEIVSKTSVVDSTWHHLAMTFDGKTVELFVDGKSVHRQAVRKRVGLKPQPGPLMIGMAVEGSRRIGCSGKIDDVRISRIIRKVTVPTAPLVADADTVAIWPFDDGAKILADPAWTPPPATTGEAWQRMSDPDWVDGRLRKMDTGPTFDATFAYTVEKSRHIVYKGLAVRLGEGGMLFDRATLRWTAGWTGGFLHHSDRRFGLLNTPTPAGPLTYHTGIGPGWADDKGAFPNVTNTLPIPASWGRYNGLYLHGPHAVISSTVHGVNVLESPGRVGDVLTRIVQVATAKKPLKLSATGAMLHDPTGVCKLKDGLIEVPPSDTPRRFQLVYGPMARAARDKLGPVPDLEAWTKPGPTRWPIEIVTRGEMASNDAPYVVDTLTIPYENPYNALFFCTGLDFLPDGRLAVCTGHGDVWIVAYDTKLTRINWSRYATGLYQPLGLKVIDGKIVVLERGQLTRLHGEKEAHYYENICSDWHTGSGEHAFDTCLETDPEGNFYFFKTGDTNLPHGGCLMRASRDGKKVEVFSTGFRHPIGLGVGADGTVTGADQEGNWMPSTRVDVYKKGGFYGDMRAHHRETPPKTYDGPLIWLPKDIDNSAGGQTWVAHENFGLPVGQLLHFSYGRCKVYALHRQKVDGIEQGSIADLGVTFLSGVARGRFHSDGALYVCGLNGWQTAAKRDGCLQRLRYTGQELSLPLTHRVLTDGVHLRYARKLDPEAIKSGWLVEQWDYRWSGDYGSKRWSVRTPTREGMDQLKVKGVKLDDDGKGVFLTIEDLRPAMQMRIGHSPTKTVIHSTIHRLEKR